MKTMKLLLAICMIITASFAWAGGNSTPAEPAPHLVVVGKVLEINNTGHFSYLRLDTKSGETWAAVLKAPIKKGDTVTISNARVFKNFRSSLLKRTFKSLVLGALTSASSGPH